MYKYQYEYCLSYKYQYKYCLLYRYQYNININIVCCTDININIDHWPDIVLPTTGSWWWPAAACRSWLMGLSCLLSWPDSNKTRFSPHSQLSIEHNLENILTLLIRKGWSLRRQLRIFTNNDRKILWMIQIFRTCRWSSQSYQDICGLIEISRCLVNEATNVNLVT